MTLPVITGLPVTSLPTTTPSPSGQSAAPGFADLVGKMVESVQSSDTKANTALTDMLDGKADVHDAMIAMQQSDLTMQLTVQVRNKLVQAYQEIMRMPV
jgi:flagellar hook-basal body complex protein FliE